MKTERLLIRKFESEDLNDFSLLIRDKMNSEYSVYDEQFPTDPKSLRQLLSYFIQSDEFFAVELEKVSKVIGFVSLNRVDEHTRNLGYCIHTDYWHHGFATELIARIKQYAKEELKLERLISGTAKKNKPSMSLLAHNGFKIIGMQQASFVNDEDGNPILFMGCSFECVL